MSHSGIVIAIAAHTTRRAAVRSLSRKRPSRFSEHVECCAMELAAAPDGAIWSGAGVTQLGCELVQPPHLIGNPFSRATRASAINLSSNGSPSLST